MKYDNSPVNEKHKATLQSEQQAEAVLDISSLPEKNDQDVVDTSAIDQQWLTLTQDWQQQSFEKTDINKLLKQSQRRVWWSKGCFALNIIATVLLLLLFGYGIANGQFGKLLNSYFGLGGIMSLIFVYYEMRIRRHSWSHITGSPTQAIEHAISCCQSSIKYMSLIKWSALPFAALINWFVFQFAIQQGRAPLKGLVIANLVIIVTLIITEVIQHKRRREYRELVARRGN